MQYLRVYSVLLSLLLVALRLQARGGMLGTGGQVAPTSADIDRTEIATADGLPPGSKARRQG